MAFLDLSSGSDAADVKWIEIDSSLDLYASHKDFIKVVIHKVVIDKQTLGHKIWSLNRKSNLSQNLGQKIRVDLYWNE